MFRGIGAALFVVTVSCSVADLTSGGPLGIEAGDAPSVALDASEEGAFDAGADADSPSDYSDVTAPSGSVTIQNAGNQLYLDVAGGSVAVPAPVCVSNPTGGPEELWVFVPEANGAYGIVNQNSAKCLDSPANMTSQGLLIQQFSCYYWLNQLWYLRKVGAYFQIVSVTTGQCLESLAREAGATVSACPQVSTWECAPEPSQEWTFGN